MKKEYHHQFTGERSARFTVEAGRDTTEMVVLVLWKPRFDEAFLKTVRPEYEKWIKASLLDFGLVLGKELKAMRS